MENLPVLRTATAAEHRAQVDPFNAEEAIKAVLPVFDNPRKGDYLAYRAMDFSVREAAVLAGTSEKIVHRWRRADDAFALWERDRLHELQGRIAPTLLTSQFMRNMYLAVGIDTEVLTKARFGGLDSLSENEFDWAKKASDRYKSQDLLALSRALAPTREDGTGQGDVNLTVNIGDSAIDSDKAKQIGIKQMLERFKVNRDIVDSEGWTISNDD